MKRRFLLKSLLLLCALIAGSLNALATRAVTWVKTAPTDLATNDIIVVVDLTSSKAMSNNNGTSSAPSAVSVTLNASNDQITSEVASTIQWTLTTSGSGDSRTYQLAKGSDYLYVTATNNGVKVGSGERNTFTLKTGGTYTGYYLYNKKDDDERYVGCYNSNDWRCYNSINNNIKNNNIVFFKKIVSGTEVTAPEINPESCYFYGSQNVTITPASGTTAYYTTDGTNPSTTNGTMITGANASFSVTETATVKAIAYIDSYASSIASATYTKVTTYYNTIEALSDAATSTSTPVAVSFNNWVVTGVNGSTCYVTDNDAHGVTIYQSGHGFAVEDILSGTVVCNLVLYHGSAELTGLKSTTAGLTVTKNGSVTAQTNYNIANLENVNTGAVFAFTNLTCSKNGTNVTLADNNNNTLKVMQSLYNSAYSQFTDGLVYNVTGVFVLYDTNKEILPRNAADITVVPSVPSITASNVILDYNATSGEISYTINNPAGGTLSAEKDDTSWISDVNVETSNNRVVFNTTENTTNAARSGVITLTYTYSAKETATKQVTVTQEARDFAILPVEFNEGKGNLPLGFTQSGLGSDYPVNTNPYTRLKFDNTNDNLILKINAAPTKLYFDIKGNSFSGGTFKVQWSANGTTYNDLATYTELSSNAETKELTLDASTRYIKWIYTTKNTGNVGLGSIIVADQNHIYINGEVTEENVTIAYDKYYTILKNSLLRVNGTLTNIGTAANLIINDGGQLITTIPVLATMKKSITGCTYENTNNAGYYLIASPIYDAVYNSTENTNLTEGAVGYDLYAYDAANELWLNFKDGGNNQSTLEGGQGYLYANGSDMDLLFMGALNTSIGDKNDLPYVASNTLQSLYLAGNTLSHDETFYVYDGDLNKQTVNFLTINTTGDNFITNVANSFNAKAMQGFFVQSNGTGCTLSTTNLDAKSREYTNDKASLLNIMVVNDDDVIDNAIVSFCNAPVLNKFYLNENSTHIYIPKGREDFAVLRFTGESEMPVNFKAAENGTYTISVEAENLDVNYLHLIDNMTGMDVDLLATPSYTFEGKKSDYASRFRLVFDANAGNNETNEEFAFISDGNIIILNEGEATLQVIDIMGRIVSTQTVNGNASLNNVGTAGVYVLQLINGNNVKTQKIVVR